MNLLRTESRQRPRADDRTDSPEKGQHGPLQRVELLVVGRGTIARRVMRLAIQSGAHPLQLLPTLPDAPSPPAVDFPTLWRLARQANRESLDWRAMLARARSAESQETAGGQEPASGPVVEGGARFCGPDVIACAGQPIAFRRAVLVGGWRAQALEAPGADECQYLTEDTLESMGGVPGVLAVVGCGARACQWAQLFTRLGSKVHLICPGGELLPDGPPEGAALLHAQLVAEHVRLHLDAVPPLFERMGARKAVLLGVGDQQRKLLVDEVLHFGAWQSELAGLDPGAAGIVLRGGRVEFDQALRTTNERVFLAGPLAPGDTLRMLDRTARVALANARSRVGWGPWRARLRLELVPRCIHTQPEWVAVGLEPAVAAALPERFAIYRSDLHEEDSPGEVRLTAPGFVQLVIDRRSGLVCGATIVARWAEPWLTPLAILMARRLPLRALADVFPSDSSVLEPLQGIARRVELDRRALHGSGWSGALRAVWRRVRR